MLPAAEVKKSSWTAKTEKLDEEQNLGEPWHKSNNTRGSSDIPLPLPATSMVMELPELVLEPENHQK